MRSGRLVQQWCAAMAAMFVLTVVVGCESAPESRTSPGDATPMPTTTATSTVDASGEVEETLFVRIGGEDRIRALSDAFYDHMDQDPEFVAIRAMHPEDLTDIRVKLADFMCGWFGGPNYYLRKHGPPRLPRRHQPFPIGSADRDEWVACMTLALDDLEIEGDLRAELDDLFYRGADFVRNRD
jgi:hemoglobin